MRIDVVKGPPLRSGTLSIVGFIPAAMLVPDGYNIPYYNPNTLKGYQRPAQEARVNQLANDLRKKRTDLPTAILLNLRGRNAQAAVVNNQLILENVRDMFEATKFYVVDGQHRVLALKKLIDEDREKWSDFMIPFVCLLGASEEEEMEQFYIVNSTAKSVKTDLALTILKRLSEQDQVVYVVLQERGREWQVEGQSLVERLAKESRIWRKLIRLPGMTKGETTIPSASMVTSLKPLLMSPYFGGLKEDQKLTVIESFWRGIRELLRPAFDEPTNYAIQKGVGVIAMHSILPHVLEIVRNRGLSTVDSESYKIVMAETLNNLEGDDGYGNPVSGIDFWAAAPKGAAGSYSSSAGRRVLAAKLRQLLPNVEIMEE